MTEIMQYMLVGNDCLDLKIWNEQLLNAFLQILSHLYKVSDPLCDCPVLS